MKFCEQCDSLLDLSTKTGALIFQCPRCFSSFDSQPDDSLMFVHGKAEGDLINQKIIKNAPHIRSIPKVEHTCNKCKNTIVSYIRNPNDFRRIFICICGHYWS